MTRRAKSWLAIAGLVVVLLGFGVALAATTAARVRYWAWRMRSNSREDRLGERALVRPNRPR